MGRGDPPTPPNGVAHFSYSRPPRDRLWGILFGIMWAVCIGFGIYVATHGNSAFISDYTDPKSCPLDAHGRRLLEEPEPQFSFSQFMQLTGKWLAVSAVLALGLGIAFIHLFKHHSDKMTKVTIGSQIAIPLVVGVLLLLGTQILGGCLFLGMAALSTFVFRLWRDQIDLATRLLGVSAHGLAANPGIITVTVLLNIGSLLAILPLCVFIAFGFTNGEVVPNPARQGSLECVDQQGIQVVCCSWQINAVGQSYIALASFTILWTMLLANQIRVFVTSGAIAQWYFAPPSLCAPRGTTMVSLKHAVGPSFGSLCLSSLVLTVVRMIRDSLERAQQQRSGNNGIDLMRACLICLAQCFWSLVEFLTKFATVMMAISGEAFLAAGRSVTDLLVRNMLNTFASTIWFTPMVIQMAVFLLSTGWALLSGGTYWWLHRHSSLEATPGLNAAILGVSVWVLTLFILNFLGGILLSVLDAVFICWAIDRDSQTVSHPEVYAVFQTVPIPGAVVEQPDGDILYGAGQPASTGDHQYQPPGVAHV